MLFWRVKNIPSQLYHYSSLYRNIFFLFDTYGCINQVFKPNKIFKAVQFIGKIFLKPQQLGPEYGRIVLKSYQMVYRRDQKVIYRLVEGKCALKSRYSRYQGWARNAFSLKFSERISLVVASNRKWNSLLRRGEAGMGKRASPSTQLQPIWQSQHLRQWRSLPYRRSRPNKGVPRWHQVTCRLSDKP